MNDLKVGQKLWFVPSQYSGDRYCKFVTIEKIGRKWVTIQYSNDQFDKSKLINGKAPLDGGRYSSPGYVYLDQNLHDQEVEFRLLKWKIIALLQDSILSFEQMSAIEKILEESNVN
jgi:hypothetical protein